MTLEPADARASVCQSQVSSCYNACGSVASTIKNFCNVRTMGWNCMCMNRAAEKAVGDHEWPIATAECRAALNACNDSCAVKQDPTEKLVCFTSCTADYQCNTQSAPKSNLRVLNVNDKPKGYLPPVDDKEIGLTIGMKFGPNAPGLDSSSRKLQNTDDPASLPKFPPSLDDDESAKDSKKGKGAKDTKANDEANGRNKPGVASGISGPRHSVARFTTCTFSWHCCRPLRPALGHITTTTATTGPRVAR
ncbi:hypothetical protein DL89DRAFT_259057 [Linderina pennispora]|uniref:DUF7707 domain-containing protein n=1 Tax=Linderina pennispora TaxID=61395 RepID=A0A1Y1W3D3_9FUNG|nr:uncharacterized protein DL89DRAFT_259057 [Linderina pennispora]ORX67805.1 hypothetical protein DL89DRAFT_259057 [Linderina pennispora]